MAPSSHRLIALVSLLAWVGCAAHAQTSTVAPRGTSAAIGEVASLREQKTKLDALVIAKDREIANLRYTLNKRILELQADIDQLRLSTRAIALLPTLREIFKAGPEDVFDWNRGVFLEPAKPTTETPAPITTESTPTPSPTKETPQ